MKKILMHLLAIIMMCMITVVCSSLYVMGKDDMYSSETSVGSLKIGDYIQFGQYDDEPILWRYVVDDKNGKLIISDKMLCAKFFDSGPIQQGNIITNRNIYGSNYWGNSNIRSWLNSDAPAGEVQWLSGHSAILEGKLGYDSSNYADEKGFLADGNFTAAERKAIKEVTQKALLDPEDADLATSGSKDVWNGFESAWNSNDWDKIVNPNESHYDEICSEEVIDKVFLLDINQIWDIYQNREALGDYWLAEFTQKAKDAITAKEGESLADGIEDEFYSYWLRTPYGIPKTTISGPDQYTFSGCEVLQVIKDYNIENKEVSYGMGSSYANGSKLSDTGIRPAFYLDTDNALILSGSGTKDDPYIINGKTDGNSGDNNTEDNTDSNKKEGISVYVNGSELYFDQSPIIENDRTLVPFRAIFEGLGAEVGWDEAAQTVTGKLSDSTIQLTIRSETAYVNEKPIQLDVPPKLLNDRTLIPLRFVAENFGFKVDWDEKKQRVDIINYE